MKEKAIKLIQDAITELGKPRMEYVARIANEERKHSITVATELLVKAIKEIKSA